MLTSDRTKTLSVKIGRSTALPRTHVTPRGEFIAHHSSDYGLFGNRGVLHDDHRKLIRPFASSAWIACAPSKKSNDPDRSKVERPRYTHLYFLDEPSALAAGHRPCWSCRRGDFNRFVAAWVKGNAAYGFSASTSIVRIDAVIHRQRIGTQDRQVTFYAPIRTLPDGCMVSIADDDYLIRGAHLYCWSPDGYISRIARPVHGKVRVVTPRSIVWTLRAGYLPQVHPSVAL